MTDEEYLKNQKSDLDLYAFRERVSIKLENFKGYELTDLTINSCRNQAYFEMVGGKQEC